MPKKLSRVETTTPSPEQEETSHAPIGPATPPHARARSKQEEVSDTPIGPATPPPAKKIKTTPYTPSPTRSTISKHVSPVGAAVMRTLPEPTLLAKLPHVYAVNTKLAWQIFSVLSSIYYTVVERNIEPTVASMTGTVFKEARRNEPTKGRFHHEKLWQLYKALEEAIKMSNLAMKHCKAKLTTSERIESLNLFQSYLSVHKKQMVIALKELPAIDKEKLKRDHKVDIDNLPREPKTPIEREIVAKFHEDDSTISTPTKATRPHTHEKRQSFVGIRKDLKRLEDGEVTMEELLSAAGVFRHEDRGALQKSSEEVQIEKEEFEQAFALVEKALQHDDSVEGKGKEEEEDAPPARKRLAFTRE